MESSMQLIMLFMFDKTEDWLVLTKGSAIPVLGEAVSNIHDWKLQVIQKNRG